LEYAGRADELHHLLKLECVNLAEVPYARQDVGGVVDRLLKRRRVRQSDHCENAWYATKERIGDTGGFLADVARAWRLAERGDDGTTIALQCRYALILSSIKSLAQNIHAQLLVALVHAGQVRPDQALAYAQQMPRPELRAEALGELALLPAFEKERQALLNEALQAARGVRGSDYRGLALSQVAAHLTNSLQSEVWCEAFEAFHKVDIEHSRRWVLLDMIPHLSADAVKDAFSATQTLQDDADLFVILAELTSQAPRDSLTEALSAIKRVRSLEERNLLLFDLAHTMDLSDDILVEILSDSLVNGNEIEYSWTLTVLARLLTPQSRRKALQAVRNFQDRGAKCRGLIALAPWISSERQPELWAEALHVARDIKDSHKRFHALLVNSSFGLPTTVMEEAQRAAHDIKDLYDRSMALTDLASCLPDDQRSRVLEEALTAAREIENAFIRVKVLIQVSSQVLPEQQSQIWNEALSTIGQIEDEEARRWTLIECTPSMPASAVPKVLSLAQDLTDEGARGHTLLNLVGKMADIGCYEEALEGARSALGNPSCRSQALAVVAPKVAEAGRYEQALAAAQEIGEVRWRGKTLAQLAVQWPTDRLTELLIAAREIGDGETRDKVLVRFVQTLAEADRGKEALNLIRTIGGIWQQSEALIGIAPYLSENLVAEALVIGYEIDWDWCRSRVLASLANHLPLDQQIQVWEDAFAAAQKVQDSDWIRDNVIEKLIEAGHYDQVLTIARKVESNNYRNKALSGLAVQKAKAGRSREALATIRSIKDAKLRVEAFSRLVPHLSTDIQFPAWQEALTSALAIESESDQSDSVAVLAPYLPDELLVQTMSVVKGFENARVRGETLAELAPHFLPQMLSQALACARSIENRSTRCQALIGLAAHLPTAQKPEIWAEIWDIAGEIERAEERCQVLTDLAPHLPTDQQPKVWAEAMATARQIEWVERRHLALIRLSAYLPADERTRICVEAVANASTMDGGFSRSDALSELIPELVQAGCYYEALMGASQIDFDDEMRYMILTEVTSHWARGFEQDCAAAYALWQEALPIFSHCPRPSLLWNLAGLSPAILTLGGRKAISQIIRAIQDVGRWWP